MRGADQPNDILRTWRHFRLDGDRRRLLLLHRLCRVRAPGLGRHLDRYRWHLDGTGQLGINRKLVTLTGVGHTTDGLLQARTLGVGSNQVGAGQIHLAKPGDLRPAVLAKHVDLQHHPLTNPGLLRRDRGAQQDVTGRHGRHGHRVPGHQQTDQHRNPAHRLPALRLAGGVLMGKLGAQEIGRLGLHLA